MRFSLLVTLFCLALVNGHPLPTDEESGVYTTGEHEAESPTYPGHNYQPQSAPVHILLYPDYIDKKVVPGEDKPDKWVLLDL